MRKRLNFIILSLSISFSNNCLLSMEVDKEQGQIEKTASHNIIWAITIGSIDKVKDLIRERANLNIKENILGNTPLMIAVLSNNLNIVNLLTDAKVNLDIKNSHGLTALMLAILNSRNKIAKTIINARANLDIQDNFGNTALDIAQTLGNKEIIEHIKLKM